jgi:hypothetical protein
MKEEIIMRQAIMIKSYFDSYKVPMFEIIHLVETEIGCKFYSVETNNTDYLSDGWEEHYEDEEDQKENSFDEVRSTFESTGYTLYILDNAS